MRFKVLIAVVAGLLATASVAEADQSAALLTGYEESPSVSTTGRGEFTATIDLSGDTIRYTETYDALQAPDIASLIQALPECVCHRRIPIWGSAVEKSDNRCRRRLGMAGTRPRHHRSAKKTEKFPAPHLGPPTVRI
jgi:hypothetical protein